MLGLALGGAPGAFAATISVTTEEDVVAADGRCSLREAIAAANADGAPSAGPGECDAGSGADQVVLPAGTFALSVTGPSDDTNVAGDLDILGTELTIAGAGASVTTIDAKAIDRAIDVRVGRIATIRHVTVTGGRAPSGANGGPRTGSGGGHTSGDPGDPGEPGGGIRNLGTLTVLESTISGNTAGAGGTGGTTQGGNASVVAGSAAGGDGADGGVGGGIFNSGVLAVIRSTVTGNTAGAGGAGGFGQGGQAVGSNGLGGLGSGGSGGDGGDGGGIGAGDGATSTIQDSSIVGNDAGAGGHGGFGQGGAGGPSGVNSGATGGSGGQGNGGPGGPGGGGGGISATGSVVATGVLLEVNAAGAGGDGGNGGGSVGGPALGTGNGGNGGMGMGSVGGRGGPGGGVLAISASVVDGTLSSNVTGSGGAGGNGSGGQGGGAVSGTGGNGGVGDAGNGGDGGSGGGLRTQGGSTIRHATIASNGLGAPGGAGTATGGAAGQPGGSTGFASGGSPGSAGSGGAASAGGATTLANSITAGNAGPSCAGSVQDGQHDVAFPDASCPGANVDPLLAALADNGGPTKTSAIAPGSPALDAVPSAGAECAQTDQRGVGRPQGAGCDAGAYEWAPPGVVTGQAIVTSPSTATLQGTVNPNARATSYHFELGTTTGYGNSTPTQTTGAGTAALAVEATLDGLEPGVTYHYRLVATNADGSAAGEDRTFVIPTRDTDAPRFLSASLAPRIFAVNRRGRSETPVAARTRRGTTFRYTLSEAARVLFTIKRAKPGRRVGRRCVKPTRRNRDRRRCRRFVLVRRFAAQAAAGANRKRFSGKIGRKSLAPGTYLAVLTARDAAGNVSAPKRLRFRVIRAR